MKKQATYLLIALSAASCAPHDDYTCETSTNPPARSAEPQLNLKQADQVLDRVRRGGVSQGAFSRGARLDVLTTIHLKGSQRQRYQARQLLLSHLPGAVSASYQETQPVRHGLLLAPALRFLIQEQASGEPGIARGAQLEKSILTAVKASLERFEPYWQGYPIGYLIPPYINPSNVIQNHSGGLPVNMALTYGRMILLYGVYTKDDDALARAATVLQSAQTAFIEPGCGELYWSYQPSDPLDTMPGTPEDVSHMGLTLWALQDFVQYGLVDASVTAKALRFVMRHSFKGGRFTYYVDGSGELGAGDRSCNRLMRFAHLSPELAKLCEDKIEVGSAAHPELWAF